MNGDLGAPMPKVVLHEWGAVGRTLGAGDAANWQDESRRESLPVLPLTVDDAGA